MNKIIVFLLLAILTSPIFAQEKDNGQIIDEVVAVVGSNIILHSDIEAQYVQYRMQGNISGGEQDVKCKIMESLLVQKMLLNQADIDSLVVTENQIAGELDRRLRYFIGQIGSQEKLEEYYKKTISEIKDEMRVVIQEQLLTDQAQAEISKNVNVTPSEVKKMFKDLDKDSIPMVNTKVVIAQIVKQPEVSIEQKITIKEKLRKLRNRIVKGERFKTLAILYSEDPGSAKNGGELGFYGRGELYPEFEAVAFKLKKGEISEIVETKAGYHILELIERRGEYVNIRHILLMLKVSPIDLANASLELDTIISLIKSDSLTFQEAVEKYSDAEDKNKDGILVNPYTSSDSWELDQLDPKVLYVVDKMKVDDVSRPVLFDTPNGTQAYRIIKLLKKTDPHRANLNEDYFQIQNWALEIKRQNVMNSWVKERAEKTYIRINPEFLDCNFEYQWFNKK